MRIEELVVLRSDGLSTVSFHPRLTMLTGLSAADRIDLVDTVHRSMNGADSATELHYQDEFGRSLVVRRSGGRRRVSTAQRGAAGSLPLPGPADLPRITHIKAADLGIRLDVNGEPVQVPSVPTIVERLIGWMGRARNAGGRGQSSLAVLDEPLRGLDPQPTCDVLDAIERLSDMVQIVYLTSDPTISGWAERVARDGRISLLGIPVLSR
jgi:hypothetical protein